MNKTSVYRLLNIHASESPVVFRLLGIQAAIGLATAFLASASYSLFLYHFPVTKAPVVYLLAAFILFPINALYARLDLKLNSKRLLQVSIVFAAISMSLLLLLWVTLKTEWLVILFVAWNLMLYMVVGYAYWGLASLLFNVRESRRIFSVIGAGDLPAKAIGYYVVAVLAPVTGINAIMAASVVFFLLAFFLCKKLFAHSAINWESYESEQHHVTHEPITNWWLRLFENKLIQWIAALSLVAYVVFYLVEFTFLIEVKIRYKSAHELSAFIGMFFATGRLVSIFVKLLFTSRLINRLGLKKSLLITPLVILLIAIAILLVPMADPNGKTYLYAFGLMAILCEVLRNTIQEPVFFILFQPMNIHLRLKGHLVAKGYVFPPALLIVGSGLMGWLYFYDRVSITGILWVVAGLIVFWLLTIGKIGRYYFDVVQSSIQKGFFTGVALFLNDDNVINTLVEKTKNGKVLERIHALTLLEKSKYNDTENLLNELLACDEPELQQYILKRLQHYRFSSSLQTVQAMLAVCNNGAVKLAAFETVCQLDDDFCNVQLQDWDNQPMEYRKALLESAASKPVESVELNDVEERLAMLASSDQEADQLLLLEIIEAVPVPAHQNMLAAFKPQQLTDPVFNRLLEAAGKLHATAFLPHIWQAFSRPNNRPSAITALYSMKEQLFEDISVFPAPNTDIQEQLATIAGKTKTAGATNFLLQLYAQKQVSVNTITNALWQLQYSHAPTAGNPVYEQTNNLLASLQMKKGLWQQITGDDYQHLSDAVFSEIETDTMVVLQLLAMQYGRQKLLRVIEMMDMRHYGKMHNAIELLELSLPHHLFARVNEMLDFITVSHKKIALAKNATPFVTIASSILSNASLFNDWTRSLTWWLAGREQGPAILPQLAAFPDESRSRILKETKEFVIFAHNHNSY